MSNTRDPRGDAPALPLAGMRIIELSSYVASPLAGMVLAQLGADVIRIDPLGGAHDRLRWPLAPTGESLYWAGLNKGKRSLTVNLRSEGGRRLVGDIIEASGPDGGIVLTNAREVHGLTDSDLRRRRQDLIHLRLTGQRDGSTAVDYTANATSGFAMVTGDKNREGPVNHVVPVWDVSAGLYIAIGLLAAERHRRVTGLGQSLQIALEDVAVATAGNLGYLAEAELSTHSRERMGNQVYGDFGRDFVTADGVHVMLLVLTSRHWTNLTEILGIQELVPHLERQFDADFKSGDERYAHRGLLNGLVASWFAERTFDEIESALKSSSLLWSRYQSFTELVASGDLAVNPLMSRLDQPGIGQHFAPGPPLVMNGTQVAARRAPAIGEHTDDVLSELLRYTDAEIKHLHDSGVVE